MTETILTFENIDSYLKAVAYYHEHTTFNVIGSENINGTYTIEATTYGAGQTGNFDITLNCPGGAAFLNDLQYEIFNREDLING